MPNLEKLIQLSSATIWARGEEYFRSDAVLGLKKNKNTWTAVVEGSYVYNVEIEIVEEQVSEWECDCPYDYGPVCKHVIAVALAIENKCQIDITPAENNLEEWEKLIHEKPLEELVNFLLDFGKKNKNFRHQISVFFAKQELTENSDNTAYYRNLVENIFENYAYEGYIDYREGYSTISEVNDLLSNASVFYNKSNLNEAFGIASAIIMESIKAFEYMDDSSGILSGVIYEAFQMIEDILNESSSEELTSSIFQWLCLEVQKPDYNNYGMGEHLEALFFDGAIKTGKISIAHQIIDSKLQELDTEENWRQKYDTPKYLLQKVDLLKIEGKEQEAELLINDYLQYDSIRELKVKQVIGIKNYKLAEELISDGIKIAKNDQLSGLVQKWKDQLLKIYKLQKNKEKHSSLSRELFIENSSNIKYLKTFKKTIDPTKWEKERTKVIEDLKKNKSNHHFSISVDDLAKVYILEQMTDELFELVASSNSIDIIMRYTKHLKTKFNSELIEFYKAAIEIEARHTGRSNYLLLIQYLKAMAKLKDGLQPAKELKNELLQKYKIRPAMKDEFKKLNWNL